MTSMKRDWLPCPTAEAPAIGAKDQTERHVLGAHRRHEPARHLGDGEDHLQVLGLLGADDIEQASRTDPLDTVEHAGQVARGVRERPGAAADDQRQWLTLAVGEARREHDQRAVGLLQQTERIEALQHAGHQRLVSTLTRQVGVGEEHPSFS